MNALIDLFRPKRRAAEAADTATVAPTELLPADGRPDMDVIGRALEAERAYRRQLLEEAEERIGRTMADGTARAAYDDCLRMRDALAACRSIV